MSVAVLATCLLLPVASWGAVPRTGDTFSPRTGTELVEAATAVSNEGATNPDFRGVIQLSAGEYSVASTLNLVTVSAATLRGPASGRAVITNISGPIPLLRFAAQSASAGSGVSNVDFTLKSSDANANTRVAVDLLRGGQLRDSTVTVPATASATTAVRLSPSISAATPALKASMQRVRVVSSAAAAPAVQATNGSQLLDSTIQGGSPTLDIVGDASGADLGPVTVDSTAVSSAGSSTLPPVRVRARGNHLQVVLWSTVVNGTATSAGQLVDIGGPSNAAGALEVDLGQSTLRGVASSIATKVRSDQGTAKVAVRMRGLLSLGSQFAVDCQGTAASLAQVTVSGVYRVGNNMARTDCEFSETGRELGTLVWRDEAAGDLHPVWDSPLVDVVTDAAVPDGVGDHDFAGGRRFEQIGTGAPGDIGALEYQLTTPENVAASYSTLGNRGRTALLGEGTDPDPLEEPSLRFVWTFPDDSTAEGPVALYRFASSAPQQVKLAVIDVTGVTVRRTFTVQPVIRLDQPATDENVDPIEPVPADPASPTDPDGGGGLPITPVVIPVTPKLPAAQVVPTTTKTGIDPSLKQEFPPILKKVTAKNRRVMTNRRSQPEYAAARSGEAEFVIETWRKSEMALEVSNVVEGQGLTVGLPVATLALKQFKGRKTLRVGAKIGKRKLKPGLYQMTIAATPRPGAVPERISFFVRVLRAR